jgi:hypothetical protein
MESGAGQSPDMRDQALQSLKKKQGFKAHLATYVCVNLLLIAIWAIVGGFFWPMFVILGWGIGVAANAWDVYGRKPITEEDIEREAEWLRARGKPAAMKEPGRPGEGRPVP